MENQCIFCDLINKKDVLFSNEYASCFFDNFPVSKGHILIIPNRHVRTYFDLNKNEIEAIFDLSIKVKEYIDNLYHPDGYNIGFNVEESGGQSVFHCHMHVIPRYQGDIDNPRGGIRKILRTKK